MVRSALAKLASTCDRRDVIVVYGVDENDDDGELLFVFQLLRTVAVLCHAVS
jgi:hypothetical protein